MSLLTTEQLAIWREQPEPTDTNKVALWQLVLDAVEAHFTAEGGEYTAPEAWEALPDVQAGLLMQANRLLSRTQTPSGVAGWSDLGVVRIGRFDPDIETMLSPYRNWNMA